MQHEPGNTGCLYVVATPIGNLEDITLRAVKTLQNAGAIACEDTRRASILLKHFDITGKKLISYHNFNEARAVLQITRLLEDGVDVCLTTDAGTPIISDPGYSLIHALREKGFPVIPIPGPSALTAALSVCPLPVNNFFFAGFLPHKKGRKSRLAFLSSLNTPVVFYESPHRIIKLLDEFKETFPDSELFIAREMTKIHEEYSTGTLDALRERLEHETMRGEFVVVVNPAGKKNKKNEQDNADHY